MPGDLSHHEISDRLLISEVLDTFAAAVDARDWDAVASVFAPDAVLDYSSVGGPRGSVGEVVGWIREALSGIAVSQHLITNRQISVDGDEATVRASLFNPIGVPGDDEALRVFFVGGYYRDRLRRNENGWRIVERVAEMTWSRGLPGRFPRS